jgi:hypothetical protein
MDQKEWTPSEKDDGTIKTATLEQLQNTLRNVDRMPDFLLDPYIEWVDGHRTWSRGNAFALEWAENKIRES